LFKITIQGVSLWQLHIYVYYNPNWFITSIFSPFYLSLFLTVISTNFKILYSFLYRKCINHILNFLTSFFYPFSPVIDLPFVWPAFHNIAYICIGSIFHIWEKTWPLGFWTFLNFS
jgi:hypothetical protein